jgi:glycosyltransferase involved in cell wall biosynthesis
MPQIPHKQERILYIHGMAQIGGAEKELLLWLECLDRERFSPYVVCPRDGPFITELDNLHIPYVAISLPSWRKLFQTIWRPLAIVRIIQAIRRWNIDVLHVNDYSWAPYGIVAGRLTGRPCLIHVRVEIEPRKISRYWLNKGNMIVPVSNSIAHVIKNEGVLHENIRVLLSGVAPQKGNSSLPSTHTLATLKKITGQPILGAVAHLFPRKGLEYLVEATGRLKSTFPDIHLVIVGTGDDEYEHQLRTQVEKLELTEHVLFAGFQDQPLFFMAQCDVCVLPSVQEGFGIVLLEAMALGKPIVASHVGGIPDIVQHEKTGLLVKPADVEDLCLALSTLLNDPAKRAQMGKAGKKRVEEHFTLQRMMEQLYGLYSEALARGVEI